MNRKKKSLERLVEPHAKERYVKHFDLLDPIAHHVVVIIFISFLFIFGVFMYLIATPTPNSAVSYAIYEFKPITSTGIVHSIGGIINNIRHSEERPLVLLLLYTFWIVIFGLVNMVLFERQKR